MHIFFADHNGEVINELEIAFMGIPNISFHRMDIGQACTLAIYF